MQLAVANPATDKMTR